MNLTPKQLEEEIGKISDESYQKHMELAEIVQRSASAKMDLMRLTSGNKQISGKEVDMRYAATEDGKREAYLKIYLKGLSHKRTALILEHKANSGSTW